MFLLLSPGVLICLLVLSLLYVVRLRQVYVQGMSVRKYHIAAFFLAIIIVAFVLLSPIDMIARMHLFSIHMAQAVTLTTLCAPLILFGCPAVLLRPFTTLPVVRSIARFITRPLVDSIIFNLVFLLWHAPKIYQLAQANASLYDVEMLTIFFVSLLNWWPLLGSVEELRGMSYPLQMLFVFFDGQPVDIFAFVLVFTGVVIYPHYAVSPQIAPFADQAVGGALLLLPGLVDLAVMSPLFIRWLGQLEKQTKLGDHQRELEDMEP